MDWPQLSKIELAYVKTDFSQWSGEGDECDIVDEDGSTDIIDVDMDSSSTGIENGEPLILVFVSRIGFKVYTSNNEDDSQIKEQPHPGSKRQLPHKFHGRNRVPRLKV